MSEEDILRRIQEALLPFDVYLKNAELSVADDFDPKQSPPRLGFQIRHEVHREPTMLDLQLEAAEGTTKALRYTVESGVRFMGQNPEGEKAEPRVRAEIKGVWVVEYRITKPEDVEPQGIEAFRDNGNVMYHVWPYWREFIHASCARLRLPQLILPMFRVAKRLPKKAVVAAEGSKAKSS